MAGVRGEKAGKLGYNHQFFVTFPGRYRQQRENSTVFGSRGETQWGDTGKFTLGTGEPSTQPTKLLGSMLGFGGA